MHPIPSFITIRCMVIFFIMIIILLNMLVMNSAYRNKNDRSIQLFHFVVINNLHLRNIYM